MGSGSRRLIEQIAWHEAGHCFAAWRGRLTIRYASLPQQVVRINAGLYHPYSVRDERVRFYLAGYCAEKLFAPATFDPHNSDPDFDNALKLCNGDRERRRRFLHDTDNLIRWNWEQVCAIAEALLRRGTLTGEEIDHVVHAAVGRHARWRE